MRTEGKVRVKMPKLSPIRYRKRVADTLPRDKGVYALCDLDQVPIYVGTAQEQKYGLAGRIRRHLTSARSDVIANRQLDVWEVAYVWCWPLADKDEAKSFEQYLLYTFNQQSTLVNGKVPQEPVKLTPKEKPKQLQPIEVMEESEREHRKQPKIRLAREAKHLAELLDHYLYVKDSDQLHQAIQAHAQRLAKYAEQLAGERSGMSATARGGTVKTKAKGVVKRI